MPHGLADLMGARDGFGSGFDVAQDFSGGLPQSRHVPQFCHVPVHSFELPGDVQILSSCQGLQELVGAITHFFTAKHPGPAWVVVVGNRIHVGILLQVDLGAEDVVPQSEEEHPIALELRLAAPGHGECPVFGAHLGSVRVGTQAPVGGRGRARPLIFQCFFGFGLFDRVVNVWTGDAVLEAEWEGHGKVVGVELVDEAVARADFQGQRPLSGSIFCGCQFVLDLLESCCAHLTGIVMRMAFPHNGTSTLTGKTVSCIRRVLHSFSRGGCFLRLQLLVGCIVHVGLDHLQNFGWDAVFWELLCPVQDLLHVQLLKGGVTHLVHVKDEVHDHLHAYMPMFRKYYVPGRCGLLNSMGQKYIYI